MLQNGRVVEISDARVSIQDICSVTNEATVLKITEDSRFKEKINNGYQFLDKLLADNGHIYGVTTGYGDSVNRKVSVEQAYELPINLTRFHGCGLGDIFSIEDTRAIIAARIVSLSRGFSGVRYELLEKLQLLLDKNIIPVIPKEGSVGASGDLTPLSYIAAVLIGERKVHYQGEIKDTKDVFNALNIIPLVLRPKEGLAIMNGTAVMTAIACRAYERAEYLMNLCAKTTSLVSLALKGNKEHFDERLFQAKPHNGQQWVAGIIRNDLGTPDKNENPIILQDRYSVRCAPHIIGVLADAMPHFKEVIENELNSANDNPLIDPENHRLLHGGHFYGGHIAYVMDSMKVLIGNLADLMDRQLALLLDVKFNHGLTSNLSYPEEGRASLNHGFKAVQIGVSAWTAEALKACQPASIFSRSTECHNQDKVSMGTIAARDCIRVLELTEQVQAAHILATVQAVSIREKLENKVLQKGDSVTRFMKDVLSDFNLVTEDRPLETDLRRYVDKIQKRYWHLGE